MKKLSLIAGLAFVLTAFSSTGQAASDVRSVMVRGTAICTKQGRSATTCLASNETPKAFPVWSKDGARIAYIELSDQAVALATLVVSDKFGQAISQILIKPNLPGELQSGMRFIQEIEWLTNDSLVVSGSVNPTTTEYIVYDLVTGKATKEFFDDGGGAAFSPDGRHYAAVIGGPHFTPESHRDQALLVDNAPVARLKSLGRISFGSKPLWSPDGKSIAVLTADENKRTHSVLHWDMGSGKASVVAMPFSAEQPQEMFWKGNDLYIKRKFASSRVTSSPSLPGKLGSVDEAWTMPMAATSTATSMKWKRVDSAEILNPMAKATELRARFKKEISGEAGVDQDFWCSDCGLSKLPRRSAMRD
jgi:hypothetical protein